jgi:hypothetical protein
MLSNKGRPRTPIIGSQIRNDAQNSERGQQLCSSLATQLSGEHTVRNDVDAWWRDINVTRSNAQAGSYTSSLVNLEQIKSTTDGSRTGCNQLDTVS